MFSKTKYAGLFVVAGMNLSVFTPPTPSSWNESSMASTAIRGPAAECSATNIRGELRKNSDVACSNVSEDQGRKTTTNVTVSQEVVKAQKEGEADEIIYSATVTTSTDLITEAGCTTGCNLRAESSKFLEISAKDIANINNEIQAKIVQAEKEAGEAIDKKIQIRNLQASCKGDATGRTFDKEERMDCHVSKLEDMDDEEEAEKYFKKHLKKDLEEMALGEDSEKREAALEIMEKIKDEELSDKIDQQIDLLNLAVKQTEKINQAKDEIELNLDKANLAQNSQQKQMFLNNAKGIFQNTQRSILLTKQQIVNSKVSKDILTDMKKYFTKVNESLESLQASNIELLGTTTDADDGSTNRSGALSRGGQNKIVDPTGTVAPNPPAIPNGVIPDDGNNGFIRTVPEVTGNLTSRTGRTSSGSRVPTIGQSVSPISYDKLRPVVGYEHAILPAP